MSQINYEDTLNLPKTDFPMKANLPQREPQLLARWEEQKLYEKIQAARAVPGSDPNGAKISKTARNGGFLFQSAIRAWACHISTFSC